MTSGAKSDQILRLVRAVFRPGPEMMNFQMAGVITALAATLVAVPGQDFTPDPGWDGGFVAFTGQVDPSIAIGGFDLCPREFGFTVR